MGNCGAGSSGGGSFGVGRAMVEAEIICWTIFC